jgi:tetratricopeptide (TPR) repeat protein
LSSTGLNDRCLGAGDRYVLNQKPEEAAFLYRQYWLANELRVDPKAGPAAAERLFEDGRAAQFGGDIRRGEQMLLRAEALYSVLPNADKLAHDRVENLHILAWLYFEHKRAEDGAKVIRQALDLEQNCSDPNQFAIAELERSMGFYYKATNQPDREEASYEKAAESGAKAIDKCALGLAYSALADCKWRQHRYSEALVLYGKSLPLVENTDFHLGISHCYSRLALAYREQHDLVAAKKTCEQGLGIFQRRGLLRDQFIVYLLDVFSTIQQDLNNPAEAKRLHDLSDDIRKKPALTTFFESRKLR